MRMTMGRDTIAATIGTTTVGKGRARSDPGFFFARSDVRRFNPQSSPDASGQGQRRYETLEQCDEPLAGHSDRGDNGQGDKACDETVFDRGRAVLIAQKFPKHSMVSRALTKTVWHAQVAIRKSKSVKL